MIHKLSLTCLALAVFSLTSCGGDAGTSSAVTGHYDLDAGHFADHMADKLIETGRAPAALRYELVNQLKSARFSLDLDEDGTFQAEQSIADESHSYSGSWSLIGSEFKLDQTHEDGEEVFDTMTGTFDQGQLSLVDEDEGVEVTIILRHARLASAASPGR